MQFIELFSYVHGKTNRPGLMGNRSRDCPANPPGRIRVELYTGTGSTAFPLPSIDGSGWSSK